MLTGILKWIFRNFAPFLFGISIGVGFFFLLMHVLPILPAVSVIDWPMPTAEIGQEAKKTDAPPSTPHMAAAQTSTPMTMPDLAAANKETPDKHVIQPQEPAIAKEIKEPKTHTVTQKKAAQKETATHAAQPAVTETDASTQKKAASQDSVTKEPPVSTTIEAKEPQQETPAKHTTVAVAETTAAPKNHTTGTENPVTGGWSGPNTGTASTITPQTAIMAQPTKPAMQQPSRMQPVPHETAKTSGCGTPPLRPGRAMDQYLACQWRENCLSRLQRARKMIERDKQQCPSSGANARSCLAYYHALEKQYHPTLCNGWPALQGPRRW